MKTKVYLYTDIDIFKTKTSTFFCLFVFWDEEGIKRNEKDSGKLWRSCWEDKRGSGHTKLGMGAKGRLKTALKTTSLFDYWQLCNANGLWNQWTYVIHRGKSLEETELKWLQLPLSPFCLSFISSALPLLLLFDGHFSKFQDRMDRDACFHIFQFMLLPVSFPCACLWLTSKALQSNSGSPLSLLVTCSK